MSTTIPVFTSEDLERLEFDRLADAGLFLYKLTEAEIGWIDWAGRRFSVSEYLSDNLDRETRFVEIDVELIAEALAADGVDRAQCLSEDTQLQRLIWFIGPSE
jgi:hypothetical protein